MMCVVLLCHSEVPRCATAVVAVTSKTAPLFPCCKKTPSLTQHQLCAPKGREGLLIDQDQPTLWFLMCGQR